MLQTHVPAIFPVIAFILTRFRPSTLVLIQYVCVFILIRFQNAQCISVDRRPKRIEMYAFSNENS